MAIVTRLSKKLVLFDIVWSLAMKKCMIYHENMSIQLMFYCGLMLGGKNVKHG